MKTDRNGIEKRIAKRLGSLPDTLLIFLSQTTDQLDHWLQLRNAYTLVERAWIARVNYQDDPLMPLLKSGELNQNSYNRIWQLVEYYQRLWALVQLSESFVREEFKQANLPCPFSSAYELFSYIAQEQANGNFLVCLTPYKEFSATKGRKENKLLSQYCRGEDLTEKEQKLLKPTLFGISDLTWSLVLLIVAAKNATKERRALKNALNSFYEEVAQVFDLEGIHYRNQGSYAWINGKKVKGSRYGGKYSES